MMHEITPTEMANYIEKVFNNRVVLNNLSNTQTIGAASGIYLQLAQVLNFYYRLTCDDSTKVIENVSELISANCFQGYREFFDEYIYDLVVTKYQKVLGKPELKTLRDKILMLSLMSANMKKNDFCAHAFNGALYDEINRDGLDIKKEKFQKELESLSKVFPVTFSIKNLNYTKIAYNTWDYIYGPERVKNAIGGTCLKREDDETTYDYYKRNLINNLKSKLAEGKITVDDFEELYKNGMKIIDFYFKQKDVRIAFFKLGSQSPNYLSEYSIISDRIMKNLLAINRDLNNKISEKKFTVTKPGIIEGFFNELEQIRLNNQLSIEGKMILLQNLYDKIEKEYPEFYQILNETTDKILKDYLHLFIIRGYTRGGNADSLCIESGELPRNQIGIAKFKTPQEVVVSQNKFKNFSL